MCIVVDVNCLPAMLNKRDAAHAEFKPVLNWIQRGKGKLVYGGSKYLQELGCLTRCLKVVTILEKQNKTVHVSNQEVDYEQSKIDRLCSHSKFDDSHLVAIILVSRCRLLCSLDKNSHPFVKKKQFYAGKHPPVKKPKIYSNQKHVGLLVDENIASICRSCKKANKSSNGRK